MPKRFEPFFLSASKVFKVLSAQSVGQAKKNEYLEHLLFAHIPCENGVVANTEKTLNRGVRLCS